MTDRLQSLRSGFSRDSFIRDGGAISRNHKLRAEKAEARLSAETVAVIKTTPGRMTPKQRKDFSTILTADVKPRAPISKSSTAASAAQSMAKSHSAKPALAKVHASPEPQRPRKGRSCSPSARKVEFATPHGKPRSLEPLKTAPADRNPSDHHGSAETGEPAIDVDMTSPVDNSPPSPEEPSSVEASTVHLSARFGGNVLQSLAKEAIPGFLEANQGQKRASLQNDA